MSKQLNQDQKSNNCTITNSRTPQWNAAVSDHTSLQHINFAAVMFLLMQYLCSQLLTFHKFISQVRTMPAGCSDLPATAWKYQPAVKCCCSHI